MKYSIKKVLLTLAVLSITGLGAETAPRVLIAPAPTVKTVAPAPIPRVRTVAPVPTVKAVVPAPIPRVRTVAPAPSTGKSSSTSRRITKSKPVVTPRSRPTRLVQPGIKPVMAPGIRKISLPSNGIKDSVKIQSRSKNVVGSRNTVGSTIKSDMTAGGSKFGAQTSEIRSTVDVTATDGLSGEFSNIGKRNGKFDTSLDGMSGTGISGKTDGDAGVNPSSSNFGKASASELKAQGGNNVGIYSADSTTSAGVDSGSDASTTTSESTASDKTDSDGNSVQSNVIETTYNDGSKMTDESYEENGKGVQIITFTDKDGKTTTETHEYVEGPEGVDGSGADDARDGKRILGVSTQQTVVNPTNKLTGDGYSPSTSTGTQGKGNIQQGGIIRDKGNINPGSEPATTTGGSSGAVKTNVVDTLIQPDIPGGQVPNGGK